MEFSLLGREELFWKQTQLFMEENLNPVTLLNPSTRTETPNQCLTPSLGSPHPSQPSYNESLTKNIEQSLWHERMTDAGGPWRHRLCFLSTLLSQKVPEKSDIMLRCIISGQPKPEVTWYKNGQAIDMCDIISSYKFFENQYIHMLHLYCCSKNDAAVYQISAKNCFGMICCSAHIEVECLSENPQLCPNSKGDVDTGCRHAMETSEEESANPIDEKEHLFKEEESISPGTPTSSDSSVPKFNCLLSLQQLLANNITDAASSEKPLDVQGTRQTEEVYDLNDTEDIAGLLPFPNSSNTTEKQDVYCHGTMHSKVSELTNDALNNDGPNDGVLNASHQNPDVQKYISFSLPLSEAAAPAYPGAKHLYSQVSSDNSVSDYELCPEITLSYTEEFSDDDLEYLECSDVMTDYSNAVWQRKLQETVCVFLLESDDEGTEFSECCLGGREHFLSEMGCRPQVSDNTGPMDATTGFCGYHSQPHKVGVRSSGASLHSPSSLQTGMTLTLGPQQDGPSTVTDPRRSKPPTASEAAENDCPGIQGETRDSQRAGKEFTSDNQLNMDKAPTEMKPLSGELEKSGMNQGLETTTKKRVGEMDLLSKRGSQKSVRVRQQGINRKPKKLNTNLKESAAEGTFDLLYPKEPVTHPLTWSEKRASSHVRAEAADLSLRFHAEECAFSTQAEQEAKTLQTPTDSLPKEEGDANLEAEGMQDNNLFETGQAPEQSDHPQVQIQEMVRERLSLSQMPAFSQPAGQQSPSTGTTMSSRPNLGVIHKENAPLTQDLEVESCTQGPQLKKNQDREDHTPGGAWGDPKLEPGTSQASREHLGPCELSAHFPPDGSADLGEPEALSVASSEPSNTFLILENVCDASRGREAACLVEYFETGDKGTCCNTMDSPVGARVDTCLPQEICSVDLELAEGRGQVSDLCSPDDETLEVLLEAQGSEPPQSTGKNSKDRKSPTSPLFLSTFTWKMSREASDGATGKNLAEVENFASTLACLVKADRERPSPSHSGGFEERQPLSSENNSDSQFKAAGVESPGTTVKDTTDTPASHSSIMTFLQEKPATLTDNSVSLQVTKKSVVTSSIPMATKVHPAKYLAVSIAENNYADGTEGSLPQAPNEDIFQFPSSVQLGHVLCGSPTESIRQLPCLAPSVPGIHAHVPQPTEKEGFCSPSPLQTNNLSGDKSQTVDRADNRSFKENFQEKGCETEQKFQQESLPHQGFPSEDDFQESLPTTSAAQEEINLVPLDLSPENSREKKGQSSGLGNSSFMVAEATVEEDSGALSNVPLVSKNLLEESKENGPGHWEPVRKLKILTLEASTSEIWPPSQLMNSEYKESEAVPIIPNRVWTISEVLKAKSPMKELDSSETAASLSSPQCKTVSTLAIKKDVHESEERASSTSWRSLSSQYLSQPRLLESSVDPIDGKELCVTDSLSEASTAGWEENVNNINQNQEENQLKMDRFAFFKQILTCPKILESSVDPIDECSRAEKPELSESELRVIKEESTSNDGNMGQKVEVLPAVLQVPCTEESEKTIPSENSINQSQEDSERGEAEQSKNEKAECIVPTLPLSSCLAIMTHSSVVVGTNNFADQIHDIPDNDLVEPRSHRCVFPDTNENEHAKPMPSSSGLALSPFASSPERNISSLSIGNKTEKPKVEEPQIGETKPPNSSGLPAVTLAFTPGERASRKASKLLQDRCQKGSTLGSVKKSREDEEPFHRAAKSDYFPGALPGVTGPEEVGKKQESSGTGHLAEGVKKKILSRVAALRLRLEEKENARKNLSFLKKFPKLDTSASYTDEKKDQKKPPCIREEKAPVLQKRIQAEMSPDHSGNIKLSCQFAEIHEDSTIWWTKDSKSIAQVQRSAGDHSTVSLAIIQASPKDQGLYYCCIKNSYGKVTAEFNLTAEVLKQLASHQDIKGCEEIEFSQLIFKEDFLNDSYFGSSLHGQIATEELHFGEGVYRKAFRSKVMQGLMPVFKPGHACVLKVHNAIAYGTRNNDELVQKNYKLAAQECYVQNTARCYAKIYAAEAQPLEGFGEVPEIIPIFLIHRPKNNIPYATVEEELLGEFVKYSIRDGKELNFLRRESEAGQKCCTFQHWVYQKTGGCLLVTDMQGVGMKLTDVGIATQAKGVGPGIL
ncbi:alpha-protein kinase 2 isoform X2 [Choloepus didactylus]|uniref:alpha-protein kinase 2 isoform X2 n=1 Tax=Choloepus didactylus TaxID=27675 RepID=UPI00189F4521|nr:alpha-protein kinase 2 isoform X2 [Choloepus didactylus]